MARGMAAAKGGVAAGKKKGSVSDTFPIDCTCTKPAEDKIMEIALLGKFRQERSKVAGGKAGDLWQIRYHLPLEDQGHHHLL
ncbi:unnamed protein product [Miscanthus lutarioriparius]|uniref:Uncharacterized protein n=1 Tax=Miscanthus lutarioriparius TaxID=422564 RepID=A0A811MAC2_9POAL|nr:unnamed protein product [Miscanthus lutarioriparius]